jgi:hypothetical protein
MSSSIGTDLSGEESRIFILVSGLQNFFYSSLVVSPGDT